MKENKLGQILDEKGITRYKMAKEIGKHWNTVDDWTKAKTMDSGDMMICANFLKMKVTDIFEFE